MKKDQISQLLSAGLIILWLYAAISKLSHYEHSRMQMMKQMFPQKIAEILTWLVPLMELTIASLLIYNPTRKLGQKATLLLLLTFSTYIAITKTGLFGKVPCSCGSISSQMNYWQHLGFNLLSAAIALLCITLKNHIKLSQFRKIKGKYV